MSGGGELSRAQERMWFLERIHPGTAAYNLSSAIRLRGRLDTRALQAAFATLLRRHDSLRSRFPLRGEQPRRVVDEESPVAIQRIGQGAASPPSVQHFPVLGLERFARRRFDIASGPLVRAGLACMAEEDHVLVLVLHHLISDGWSMGVLHSELAALYNAAVTGGTAALAPVRGDYAEYVRSERAAARGKRFAEGLTFWRERLEGLQELRLPSDRLRPATQTLRGARRIAYLPAVDIQRLEALARSCSTSLFLVLQLAFAVLLHRCTAQRDIAIGSPFANRESRGVEDVVGLFVNTIVLRCEVDGECSFGDLLAAHRDASLEAIEHGHVPFEAVVEALCPQRSLSYNPLFQVMFALQRAEAELPSFEGLAAMLLDLDLGSTRFDLECTTWREPDRLKVRLTYASDVFDGGTVERLLERYLRLLERISRDSDTPIGHLGLLLASERNDLLARRRVLVHPDLDRDVPALFEAQAERSPRVTALETMDGSISYGELAAGARRVAGALEDHGVGPGDIVAVRARRGAEMVIAMLGVLGSGAGLLPLDREDPPDRARLLLADAGAAMALISDPADAMPAGGVRWIEVREALAREERKRPARAVAGSRVAYVIYTSGTSGRPKGVVVEHRNAVNTLVGCREWFGFDASDRFLCLASATFDIFYFELLSPLLCGASVRLVDRGELLDPARLAPLVRRATVMQAVPGLMRQIVAMLGTHGAPAPRMRHAITGGDTVPAALPGAVADAFPRATVTILYGPTEAAMVCAGISLREPRTVHGHPIGEPLANAVMRVCDAHGGLVPDGFAGEIYIGGAGVCRGYLGGSAQLAGRFVEIEGERFYRSGDLGRWRPDGCLEFMGRLDDQVKVHGHRIEPTEIEAVLESLPEIFQAAVIACGEQDARRLMAYVVPARSSSAPSERTRAAAARRHIADWRAVFDHTHEHAPCSADEHDFTGWQSSYTGAPLGREQMEDWLRGCLEEINERLPAGRRGRARILEIGCGTGLLLLALAPACECYVASDFAPRTLERLRARVSERGLTNVELYEREAGELPELGRRRFDIVILNSVCQYLPGIGHVNRVVRGAASRLVPGGFVFVGDVRNLALHELFLAGVELHREPSLDGPSLRERVRGRVAEERELLLHPAHFAWLAGSPGVARAEVALRRGRSRNELLRYRYNAILYAEDPGESPVGLQWVDWEDSGLSLERVLSSVAHERPDALALRGVPNGWLRDDLAAWTRATGGVHEALGAAEPVCPDDLVEGAARIGYEVETSWASGAPDGRFDAILHPRRAGGEPRPRWAWPLGAVPLRPANDPLEPLLRSELLERVSAALSERLPAYMTPSAVRLLDGVPVTVNGKLDRSALAKRAATESAAGNSNGGAPEASAPPATATELVLARAWSEVLGVAELARDASFFAAGGTSLLAIRVAVRLRSRGIAISAQDLFRHQTVAELAAVVDRRTQGALTMDTQAAGVTVVEARTAGAAVVGAGVSRDLREPLPVRARAPWAIRDPGRGSRTRHRTASGRDDAAGTLASAGSVLLTGATGFLGIHLLRALLRDTGARVSCLVRASERGQAERRIREQWRWYFPGVKLPRERVEALAGDVTASGLGLDAGTRRSLARDCEHVIHAAADVRHVGDGAEIFRVNLDGTRNVIELVAGARVSRLHHISTIAVKGVLAGASPSGFTESDLDVGQTPTEDYSASKLEAERAVRAFLDFRTGGTVLRVGTVAPHSVTGRFQRDGARNFFLRYLRSTVELGLGSDWPGRSYALAPVDSLARAIVVLADLASPGRETFHVSTPHILSHAQIIRALQRYGYEIRLLDPGEFVERVLDLAHDPLYEAAIGGVLGLIDAPAGQHVPLDASWTQDVLRSVGFEFPQPTAAWLARFIEGCVHTGALPRPGRIGG